MGICTCIKNISLNQNAAVPVSAKRKVSSFNKESDFGLMQNDDSNINSRAGEQATTFESVILREINIARTRPKDYADKLKQMIDNIKIENNTCFLIYNKEKVILQKGIQIFIETIEHLNSIKPMCNLKWCEEIKLTNIKFKKNINSIGNLLLEKRKQLIKKYHNCAFNIDIFADPILSAIFQITDEAFNRQRRNEILNPKYTKFAIGYTYDKDNQFFSISTLV